MKAAVVLPEIDPFSTLGGAMSRKAYEIFKRYSSNWDITVFSRPVFFHRYPPSKIKVRTIYSGFLNLVPGANEYAGKYFIKEASQKIRGKYDVAYIFNRPEYVPVLRAMDDKIKIMYRS